MHQLDQETLNGASSFYTKSVGLLYFTRGSCNKPKPTFNWIQPKKMLHKHGFSDVSDSADSLKLLLFDYSKLSWNRCWCNYCSPHTIASKMPALSFDRLNDKHYQKAANSSFAVLNFFRIEGECGDYDMPILSESLEFRIPPFLKWWRHHNFRKGATNLTPQNFCTHFLFVSRLILIVQRQFWYQNKGDDVTFNPSTLGLRPTATLWHRNQDRVLCHLRPVPPYQETLCTCSDDSPRMCTEDTGRSASVEKWSSAQATQFCAPQKCNKAWLLKVLWAYQ